MQKNSDTQPDTHNGDDVVLSMEQIEAKLRQFEQVERAKLGLADTKVDHWNDPVPNTFTAKQRAHTTLLVCGLTMAHDLFIQSALRGIGYKVKAMDVPNTDALQYGREFGNRGQCNPTYFTVGNLIKYLTELKQSGMSEQDIVKNHVFVTAGACGPCRFGTYVTEYRKALRDSGFDGFRVLLFQQTGGLKQATGEEVGLKMDPKFFWGLVRAVIIGDVLNALAYRIRPYEVEAGATNRALAIAKTKIAQAFENNGSVLKAMVGARRVLSQVTVDRTKPKPKVGIIGEFWAMTTEGDGNYAMPAFLESEGAEVDVQLVTAWLLYMVWQGQYDTKKRAELRGTDTGAAANGSKFSLEGVDVRKRLVMLTAADKVIRSMFQGVAHVMGLYDYHLADMDEIAEVSHAFYDNDLRGGEGHMEVGKLILNIAKSKVNMTLSIKPFGCMPSSSVSDGVQSLITEMYPGGIFLPIETNGDGAVNVYSRVQMQLFKAKQLAKREFDAALSDNNMTEKDVQRYLDENPKLRGALHRSPHTVGCTAADVVHEVARRRRGRIQTMWKKVRKVVSSRDWVFSGLRARRSTIAQVARVAAQKNRDTKSVNKAVMPIMGGGTAEGIANGRPKKSLRVVN